jgi:hypothetical protein
MYTSAHNVDALFVIHQDTDLNRLGGICREKGFSTVVVLSTHYLLKHEHERALQCASSTEILSFAQLLSDPEMSSCDERATHDLLNSSGPENSHRAYISRFMRKTVHYRNVLVHEKVNRMYQPRTVYFDDGLGVDKRCWSAYGGIPVTRLRTWLGRRLKATARQLAKDFRESTTPIPVTAVSNGSVCYVFFSSLKRVQISDQVQIHPAAISYPQKAPFFYSARTRKRLVDHFMDSLPPGFGEPRLATTFHQYHHGLTEIGRPLYLFVDGYFPTNYPRSYLDMYPDNCIFVTNHMFNAGWFQRHHRRTCISFPFLKPPVMRLIEIPLSRPLKTVLLALNHAGDWTSLINRSDTDVLLEAFADIASRFPGLDFIVRPHPTMATPAHEGVHALERLRGYIGWRKISNLCLSAYPLERDLQRGDIFVSEYSQVLIDALQAGKLGILANLTSRRSFMENYEALGFISVNSVSGLEKLIRKTITRPQEAVERQNQAAQKYNARLKEGGFC